MSTYPEMGPGKGADRPSCLAMNPNNVAASAARRAKLLEAFDGLPPDTRADLLEVVETWAYGGFWSIEKDGARVIIKQMHAAAGWTEEYAG